MSDDTEYRKLANYCAGLQSEWSDLEVRYDKLKKHSQNQRRELRRMNRFNGAINRMRMPSLGETEYSRKRLQTRLLRLAAEINHLRAIESPYKLLFYGVLATALFIWGAVRAMS